ncbi:MAG: polysaccharide deacetylase family protein [Eubacterium sp.]|nr:polysaccharide deacetylase family protein [Eubacterium sp.]
MRIKNLLVKFIAIPIMAIALIGCGASSDSGDNGSDQGSAYESAGDAGSAGDPVADAGTDATAEPEPQEPVITNAPADAFMLPEIEMLTGEFVDLQYQFAKKKYPVTWTSTDPSIVKVGKNGSKIKAKKEGIVSIEGMSSDGQHAFQCIVTVIERPESLIYLTFDDGPSRNSTPKILDILNKNAVHATFFELKPAKADYDLTQRVIDEGHSLAIHGYSHHYDEIYRSDEVYHKNLTKLQKLFYKDFGQWCTQTRFPGGSSNTVSRHYSVGIMSRLSKKVHEWGFLYQDWNVSSGDAGGSNTPDQVFKMVTSGIQKGRSNVILMHDFSGNDKTINALQRIIDWGKQNGFTFRGMTAATGEVHHGINN